METIVWWSAGGGSVNEEVKWKPLYGGAEGGTSLIKEVKWRPMCLVERMGGS